MKQLDKTGIPLPFRCHFAVRIDNYEENEAKAHKIYAGNRVRSNREFTGSFCPRIQWRNNNHR